jgi:Flp pilus assembly pilin Flp
MQALVAALRRLVTGDGGQDLLEYALLVALIAVVAVTAVGSLGMKVNTAFWELIASSI